MKYLRLGISRAQFTDITISVPDDFNERELFNFKHSSMLYDVANELKALKYAEFENKVEVNSVKILSPEEGEKEAKEYGCVDITQKIKEN